MPRKAKDKEELNEDKKIKKVAKKISTKKNTTKKSEKSKTISTKKTSKTTKSKTASQKSDKKSSSTKSKSNTKKEKFLVEYYDLPYKYNNTIVKLLAQTPNSIFVYWEISNDDINNYKSLYGDNFFENTFPILKIHNTTMNYSFEIEINDFANCWYINVNDSNCNYKVELLRKYKELKKENNSKNFIYISSSNDIASPNDHILFELLNDTITLKNTKTNQYRNIKISKNTDILYKNLYSEEELNNIKNLSNPSSGNPTSTFK